MLNFVFIAINLYLLTISSNCFNTTNNRGQKKNKENKKNTDNDLHNTTEKTENLATGIQETK